ncbi:DUF4124 domain-containing protein [uncultured Massilia sp.]|uniref:DUF4124 domain-containing protein n=1 Tax=uncultured Massilia sp. TaxID=169973 RepID=UPI0025858B17|nr:DUF4124 domain-containing protein [uncultured Massilia sp.]
MLKLFSLAFVFLLSPAATAGTIYKCVENGKTSYSDQPCGKNPVALDLRVAPPAPEEAAERLARSKAYLADAEAARADENARAVRAARVAQRVQRDLQAERKRCDKLRLQTKWAEEDSRRASREAGERERSKARRQAEALAVECPA